MSQSSKAVMLSGIDALLDRVRHGIGVLEGSIKIKSMDPKRRYINDVLELMDSVACLEGGNLFTAPVGKAQVPPTYWDIVCKPMDFSTIRGNAATGVYSSFKDIYSDLLRVVRNVELFHPPHSHVADAARRVTEKIKATLPDILLEYRGVPSLYEPMKSYIDCENPAEKLKGELYEQQRKDDKTARISGKTEKMCYDTADEVTDRILPFMNTPAIDYLAKVLEECGSELELSVEEMPPKVQWRVWYALEELENRPMEDAEPAMLPEGNPHMITPVGIEHPPPPSMTYESSAPVLSAPPVSNVVPEEKPVLESGENSSSEGGDNEWENLGLGDEVNGFDEASGDAGDDTFNLFKAERAEEEAAQEKAKAEMEAQKAEQIRLETESKEAQDLAMAKFVKNAHSELRQEYSDANITSDHGITAVLNDRANDPVGLDSFDMGQTLSGALTAPSPAYNNVPTPGYDPIPSPATLNNPSAPSHHLLLNSPSFGDEIQHQPGLEPTSPKIHDEEDYANSPQNYNSP